MTHRLASIGECMIELSPLEDHTFGMSFAGDTLNMAIYCARASDPSQLTVDYITALGDDHYSEEMLNRWQNEGIGTRLVHKVPGKLPGLYLIRNDERGDREFYYYRSQAAARELFEGSVGDALCQELLTFNTIYLSGISIAILHESGREKLVVALQRAKEMGITVCFDNNYRPRLWPNTAIAKATMQAVFDSTQIALPSFEDASLLFGDKTPEDTVKRLRQAGVDEIVVKLGEKGYFLSSDEVHKLVPIQSVRVVDATAAGDSFNGAYLAARIQGLGTVEAAQKGAEMAARVVTYKGAIIPRALST